MSALLNPEEWSEFLKQFATAAQVKTWPGSPGTSKEKLIATEARLKVTLPPSYRAFLTATNGWALALPPTLPGLRAVEGIKWFRKEHKDWVDAYQMSNEPLAIMERDYFNYAEPCAEFDAKHLGQALCITDIGDDAVVLLNPMVVWPDGEWEAWFFANWVPGAIRYRSFADWMRHEFSELTGQTFAHSLIPGELPTVYLDPPAKAERRIRPRERVLVLEEVLEKLNSKKDRERIKAAQQLGILGGDRAVAALIHALKNDPVKEVRWRAADSLGTLAPPEAVEPLITAIDDPLVNSTAIHALKKFSDERSAHCLLKILKDCSYFAATAAGVLADRQDARALKPLLHFLLSTSSEEPRVQHIGQIAGRMIANFQEDGFAALEPLMTHSDLAVRQRAYVGIGDLAYMAKDKVTRRKAFELLQRCVATEPNEELRGCMNTSIEISAKKNRG